MPSGQSKRTARYHTLLTTWLLETDHSTKLSLPIFYFIWHMDSNPSRTVSVVIVCLTYVSACSSIRTGNSSGSADGFREGADDLGKTSTGNSQESNVRFEAIYYTLWERPVWIHNSVTTQKEAVSGYMILWPLPLRKALSGYMIIWPLPLIKAVSGYMIIWLLPLRKAVSGYMILWPLPLRVDSSTAGFIDILIW